MSDVIPAAFKQEVAAFYAWVDAARRPILAKLWELHKQKRAAQVNYPKAIDRIPPLMSHMESFTIKNGEYHTQLLAERFYYRSCLNHVRRAQDAVPTSSNWAAAILDLATRERAEALIMAAHVAPALALGEDIRAARDALHGATDDLFRVSQSVDCRGIDPIDAGFDREMDGRDRVAIILRSPTEAPP